jgi:hypothetical protein
MSLRASVGFVALLLPLPAVAQEADVRAIYDALELPAVIDVMSREGDAHGEELAAQLFPGLGAPSDWTGRIAEIYAPRRMEEAVLDSLEASLEGADLDAMLAFFGAEPGRSLMQLELSAREAMLEEDVEQAAREAAAVAFADEEPRLDLLRRYMEANDLVETNVVSAMNSNVAYFLGLMDGGAVDPGTSEGDVLADIALQETQIRADTTQWLYAFMLLAYGPAEDADIEALIAFSETEPGQDLNRAIFVAFDEVFTDISRDLGRTSARYMTTQEL